MTAGTSVELPKELWSALSDRIDTIGWKVELVKHAVLSLGDPEDEPRGNQDAVRAIELALEGLMEDLRKLIAVQGRAA